MAKRTPIYYPLTEYLASQTANEVRLSIKEIEKIIGVENLPDSYHDNRSKNSWWGNDKTHSQGKAWLEAGFNCSGPPKNEYVTFKRCP